MFGAHSTLNTQHSTFNIPQRMSTLTKYSAIPYTGPAPTNRTPYVPSEAPAMDARGQEIVGKLPGVEQETGQDLSTFIVDRTAIADVLQALKNDGYTLPLDLWG